MVTRYPHGWPVTSQALVDLMRRAPASAHDEAFSDLTVALFSYQRRTLMHRQIALWARTNARLLILDGSDVADPEAAETAGASPNITYVHERSFARRFGHLADHLATPFGMILADDDTALRSGTQACLAELRRSPDVGTCIGQGMFALADRPPGAFTLISARGSWLGGREGYTREEPDPAERMARIAYPFVTKVYYGVQRSDVLGAVARVCSGLPAHWPPGAGVFEQVVEELSVGLAPLRSTPAVHTVRWDDPVRNRPQPSNAEPIAPSPDAPQPPQEDWAHWYDSCNGTRTRAMLAQGCEEAGVPGTVAHAFIRTFFRIFRHNVDAGASRDQGPPVALAGETGGVGPTDWEPERLGPWAPLTRARAMAARRCAPLLYRTGLGTRLALSDLARCGGQIDLQELRTTGRFRMHGH